MPFTISTYELRTHDGTFVAQPNASQLAAAITALAAPDNTYLRVEPRPDSGWYVEVTLPDPATAQVFNGPYLIHFQDIDANPPRSSEYGDDPQTMAARIHTWVQSQINSRR